MKDIEHIKKFARQRQKWEFYSKDSDLRRLERQESACWSLLFYFGITFPLVADDLFSDRILPKLATIGIIGFGGYLLFQLHKTQRLRRLFESTAVQSTKELIKYFEEKEAEPSPVGDAPKVVPDE